MINYIATLNFTNSVWKTYTINLSFVKSVYIEFVHLKITVKTNKNIPYLVIKQTKYFP